MAAPPDLISQTYLESLFEAVPAAQAGPLIAGISERAKTWCGKSFYTASYTDFIDGNASNRIQVEQAPIVSVTSIHDALDLVFDSSSLISSAYYTVNAKKGWITLRRGYAFQRGDGNIRVVYTAGYGSTEAALPADLRLATAKWVAIAWKNWETPTLGLKSIKQGENVIIPDKDSPPSEVMPDFLRYKRKSSAA